MGSYSKGAKYERELMKLLKEKGYAVVRVAGSGRARTEQPDLLASNGSRILGIECKYSSSDYKTVSKEEVNKFLKFCELFSCNAFLGFRFPRTDWKFVKVDSMVGENVSVKKSDELLSMSEVI